MHALTASHSYVVTLPFSPLWIAVAAIWTLVWKGFALWYAARGGQKAWFIILLIVNTLGILEIVYLIWFRRDYDAGETQSQDSSATA